LIKIVKILHYSIISGTILLCVTYNVNAQNLIKNPQFKNNGIEWSFKCNWCSNNYKCYDEKRFIGALITGELFLSYGSSNCVFDHYNKDIFYGYSWYARQKIESELKSGKLYIVKFDYKLTINHYDRQFGQQTGIGFENEQFDWKYGLLPISHLAVDTSSNWTTFKKTIRPMFDVKYTIFGTYLKDESLGKVFHEYHNFFHIKNPSITEIEDSPDVSAVEIYKVDKPARPGAAKNNINDIVIYYQSGVHEINENDKLRLDSIIGFMKSNPQIAIDILSYTDEVGSEKDNQLLADNRMNHVKDYLLIKGIKPERIMELALVNDKVRVPEKYRNDKIKRRTIVRKSKLKVHEVLSRKILKHIANKEYTDARRLVRMYILVSEEAYAVNAFNHPEFATLMKDSRFKEEMRKLILSKYDKVPKSELAFKIDSLNTMEQHCRGFCQLFHIVGEYEWEYEQPKLDYYSGEFCLDTIMLLNIIKDSIPKISEIGPRSSIKLSTMLAHTNSEVLDRVLPQIEKMCREGEFYWDNYALLFDKNQRFKGLPQRYGTQAEVDEEGYLKISELEDSEKVHQWRREVGLGPLPDYSQYKIKVNTRK
jgi:hypothetical protein